MHPITVKLVIRNEQDVEGEPRYDGFVKIKGNGIAVGPLGFVNLPWDKVALHVADSKKHIEYALNGRAKDGKHK